jgi:hypothetical protein
MPPRPMHRPRHQMHKFIAGFRVAALLAQTAHSQLRRRVTSSSTGKVSSRNRWFSSRH